MRITNLTNTKTQAKKRTTCVVLKCSIQFNIHAKNPILGHAKRGVAIESFQSPSHPKLKPILQHNSVIKNINRNIF